jgi:hypothetical protein
MSRGTALRFTWDDFHPPVAESGKSVAAGKKTIRGRRFHGGLSPFKLTIFSNVQFLMRSSLKAIPIKGFNLSANLQH